MTDFAERDVTVPFRGGHLTLSMQEVRLLYAALANELKFTTPPRVRSDGCMTRDDFRQFFGQVYGERQLNGRISRLFHSIVQLAIGRHYEQFPFDVRCDRCGLDASMACTAPDKKPHYYLDDLAFRVGVASLKEHAQAFLDGNWRNIGDAQKDDFRTLIAHLPE